MPSLEATQANRRFAITTPLGEDVLLFHSMSATEELGQLFQIDLDLLSEDPEIKLKDILGHRSLKESHFLREITDVLS